MPVGREDDGQRPNRRDADRDVMRGFVDAPLEFTCLREDLAQFLVCRGRGVWLLCYAGRVLSLSVIPLSCPRPATTLLAVFGGRIGGLELVAAIQGARHLSRSDPSLLGCDLLVAGVILTVYLVALVRVELAGTAFAGTLSQELPP